MSSDKRIGCSVEMLENPLDDCAFFDARDDLELAPAAPAGFDFDLEHALELLRPGHGDVLSVGGGW